MRQSAVHAALGPRMMGSRRNHNHPRIACAGSVCLTVYNGVVHDVRTLVDGHKTAGQFEAISNAGTYRNPLLWN